MAGSYMDAPAHRLAYDRDGSVGVSISNTGLLTALTGSQLIGMNTESESVNALPNGTYELAIIFPIPVDIAAIFVSANSTSPSMSVWTSQNTSTGVDGTWTQQVPARSFFQDVKPNYRRAATVTAIPGGSSSQGVVGLKLTATTASITNFLRALHIYGTPSSGATPDRLAIWHPTLNQAVSPSYFDWGNAPRSSSADKSFRIKNLSGTLTANLVAVYVEALTPGAPSIASMHTLSDNGGSTFLSSLSIPSLAPGAISSPLILRRVIPANANVSTWSARIGADVGSWT